MVKTFIKKYIMLNFFLLQLVIYIFYKEIFLTAGPPSVIAWCNLPELININSFNLLYRKNERVYIYKPDANGEFPTALALGSSRAVKNIIGIMLYDKNLYLST